MIFQNKRKSLLKWSFLRIFRNFAWKSSKIIKVCTIFEKKHFLNKKYTREINFIPPPPHTTPPRFGWKSRTFFLSVYDFLNHAKLLRGARKCLHDKICWLWHECFFCWSKQLFLFKRIIIKNLLPKSWLKFVVSVWKIMSYAR